MKSINPLLFIYFICLCLCIIDDANPANMTRFFCNWPTDYCCIVFGLGLGYKLGKWVGANESNS